MSDNSEFNPQTFAVVGAGPVGCIVAAFLAKGGYEVILCDVIPDLLAPAMDPGIIIEGAENLQQKVSRTITNIDELASHDPDVIIITVKAHVLPLIASAIEGFLRDGMYVVSWQNGIDTELELSKILGKGPVMRAVVNYGCGLDRSGPRAHPVSSSRRTTFRSLIPHRIRRLMGLPKRLANAACKPSIPMKLFPWSGAKRF